MGIRIVGTLQPVRTNVRTRFDPVKGFTVTQEYESGGNNLAGIASTARASSMDYELTANEYKSRIVLTATGAAAGYPETITSTWQLYTVEAQKDIRDHPVAIANPGPIGRAKEQFLRWQNGEATLARLDGETEVLSPWLTDTDLASKFFRLLYRGATSYNVTHFAARATINLPFAYTGAIPAVEPDSLMATVIGDLPVNGPDDGVEYEWGWRRTGTSRTFSADNRTELNLEWTLASWSLVLYSDITDLPA